MRNEPLVGYLLHQRPYQEKRALYYLFSKQHGVIHGIGKKGAPLFEPLQLFATGKRDLKTFSQINIVPWDSYVDSAVQLDSSEPSARPPQRYQQISGQQQYAALYLNEILWKLLPTEDAAPILWQHYQNSILELKQPLAADALRLCLRRFEQHLFKQLGFELTLTHDNALNAIDPTAQYQFLADMGLVRVDQASTSTLTSLQTLFNGTALIDIATLGITQRTLKTGSRLHRQLIDHLLDYQPLQSRLLWQQQQRYQ